VRVEVVRSPRRRKTVQAREVEGVLRVSIPATMSRADEERWVAEMVRRMERRSASSSIDLTGRAATLAGRYGLQRPASIRWTDNQEWRWGSCTPNDRSIRISSRLTREPSWVLDYVIVHELAHLDVPRHDPEFWALVERYRLAERARGFLIARALQHDQAGGSDRTDGAERPNGAHGADTPDPLDRDIENRDIENRDIDDPDTSAESAGNSPARSVAAEPRGPSGARRRNRRGPAAV
jgi:predicted metal-dependent hydrolase